MTETLLIETDYLTLKYPTNGRIPGYMILSAKGDVYSLADLTAQARHHIIDMLACTHDSINKIIMPERIYTLSIGEIEPRLHFHIFPRTAALLAAYKKAQPQLPYALNGLLLFDWARATYDTQPFGDYDTVNAALKSAIVNKNTR